MFSILIPTWNNLPYLQCCVRSIQDHSAFAHQIIVHINEGRDGTREWIAEQGIEHTVSDANIGICYAVNLAARHARCNYIVYLNDDMVCCPGWDIALLERIKPIGQTMFMLSGTMIEPVESGNSCVVVSDFGRDIQTFRAAELIERAPSLVRADWYGATWPPTVVRRDDWFKVGGYSSEFSPGMGSDNDFAMKMWHAGCRIFLGVGVSLIYHFQCKSTQKIVKNNGRRQFLHKWGIRSSDFDRFYLRRGMVAESGSVKALDIPRATAALRWALLSSRIKRLF